jgi:general secretion pathway protein K
MINDRQQGIALLIVMWALAALMVIVLAFSYSAHIETKATTAFIEGAEERFIAEGGIHMAAAEIMYRKITLGTPLEPGKEYAVWHTDGTPNVFGLEKATCLVRITDESGKVDLNKTPEIVFKGLLLNLGVKEEDADVIVDSVQDWRDADDLVRLHGAEDEYYMSLPSHYKPKNADFESVEELLLVRGVTAELFYGTAGKPGLAEFVTVYSESGKINLGAAPKEVLSAVPGVTPELAAAIIEFRKTVTSNNAAAIQNIAGEANAAMAPFVINNDSNTFTVEAAGRKSPDRPGYGIKAVIFLNGSKFMYRYFKSPWDMTKWKQPEK